MNATNNNSPGRSMAGRMTLAAAALAALAGGAMLASGACVNPTTYDVKHEFTIKPHGNVTPIVYTEHYLHCWSKVPGVNDPVPPCPDYDVSPWALQGPAWHGSCAYGHDYMFDHVNVRTTKVPNTGTITATPETTSIPATGLTVMDAAFANGCDPDASADAHVQIDVNPFLVGTEVSGAIETSGQVCQVEGRAYSFAMGAVLVKGGRTLRNGTIKWKPTIREQVHDSRPRPRRIHDPIEYRVTDLANGNVVEGTFLKIDADYPLETTGGVTWDAGVLEITALDVDFDIEHTDPALAQQGTLRISVRGGVIVGSSATGAYAGMAPPLGAPTPFLMPLPNDLLFDYDLGNFNGDPLEVEFLLSGAGQFDGGVDLALPCTADLNGDGLVGAADLALMLGSWGGSNPAADLNQDGLINAADLALLLGAWGPCP